MTPEEQKQEEEQRLRKYVEAAVIAALLAAGLSEWEKDEALVAYLVGNLTREAIAANPALWESLVKSVSLPVSQAAMNEARDMAMRQAATLVARDMQSQLNALGSVIADGLKRGDNPYKIADRLKMIDSLDTQRARRLDKYIRSLEKAGLKPEEIQKRAERMKEQLIRDRRETIARTETRYAQENAARVEALAAGKQYKCWITAGDDRVTEPCPSNERQGWIGIDKAFTSGHDNPPAHPNCRCTVAYRKDPPDKAAQERVDRRVQRLDIAQGNA